MGFLWVWDATVFFFSVGSFSCSPRADLQDWPQALAVWVWGFLAG